MAFCNRCGKETTSVFQLDREILCGFCFKKQDLKDQRDWEDDPENESEE